MNAKKKPETVSRFKGEYKPPRNDRLSMRSGAMNILQAPSRMGETLFYPDGKRVKDVDAPTRKE
jgi:hypothetical protein